MPDINWLNNYEKIKDKTLCSIDLNDYFEKSEIAGKQICVINIGKCDVPSGIITAGDPLVCVPDSRHRPYFEKVSPGSYDTELCVIKEDDYDCARYAAARLRFNSNRPVKFYLALTGDEDLSEIEEFEEDEFIGFPVDAGLGCFCDETVHQAYCDWQDKWDKEHPDMNAYDDYFSELFKDSYIKNPEYQREGGDWINWQIPGTDYHIPMFASGFGDGVYPVYWGVDKNDCICQIVINFIDIELAYSDEDDE